MKILIGWLIAATGSVLLLLTSFQDPEIKAVTVPMTLDHNRILVDAEVQRINGSWRKARLWVDTGNPEFFISESFAQDLGIDLSEINPVDGNIPSVEIHPPSGVRIGGMTLNFEAVKSKVMFQPAWLFSTMHNDANLPSTVLQRYQVVFDYPGMQFTIEVRESFLPHGIRIPASINTDTGIVQIDAHIDGQDLSFALDIGASYSFASDEVVERLSRKHAKWPRMNGALGCANIWGWWPKEEAWQVVRIPKIQCGSVPLEGIGIVGLPPFGPSGTGLDSWYSQKTARPVVGFLGSNAFKSYRIEIDYSNSAVYFEKGAGSDAHDMDLIGLTIRLETDGRYRVIGVAEINGKPSVEGVVPGDVLLKVGNLEAINATMGTVVDALRGKPGDTRKLLLERDGKQYRIEAKVMRFL